jgi:general L-amino acid transport system permease protein
LVQCQNGFGGALMMSETQAFVRTVDHEILPPPFAQKGAVAWVRKNLLSTPFDTILTVLVLLFVTLYIPPILRWLFVDAQWTGTDRSFCTTTVQGGIHTDGWSGACWAFVGAKFQQFMVGRYPVEERWRVLLAMVIFIGLLVPLAMPKLPRKGLNALLLFAVFPVIAYFLIAGGYFGLPFVETPLWGGLLVTLVISFVGITVSLPLGILLALGRRSNMPVIKMFSVIFIEVVRGVPLVTVLFMASVMLPLFLPPGVSFDKLMRALIGVALFSSAYMAEVVRGGLQAIPKGQSEGADSLGLSFWQKMWLIVMPQALKLVIPSIVNSFISLFKDTSLDPTWSSPSTPRTGLIFAAFIFWIFCFSMSRYSQFIERRLETGHKR